MERTHRRWSWANLVIHTKQGRPLKESFRCDEALCMGTGNVFKSIQLLNKKTSDDSGAFLSTSVMTAGRASKSDFHLRTSCKLKQHKQVQVHVPWR